MKFTLLKKISTTLLMAVMMLFVANSAQACDRSYAVLDSVVYQAGYVDIAVTTFIGAGVTGFTKGGDASTRTFAFGVWGSGTLQNIDFTPSITSDSTKTTYMGTNNPGAFGTSFAIAYIYNGIDFTCVSSTANCGNRHTNKVQIIIRCNELPDSIRVLGIEGAGNPFSGCYPDADLLLDMTSLPVVWAGFEAQSDQNGVGLEWNTASETNNDRFLVQRSSNGTDFETISEVEAVGNSSNLNSYRYFDQSPLDGTNFYQIVQVDIDGKSSSSEVLTLEFAIESGLFWTAVGPNPVHDALTLSFNSGSAQTLNLQLLDVQGRVVRQKQIPAYQGANQTQLDLSGEASGFYYLRISSQNNKIDKKILKM